jgi:hypothetical protein
MDKYTNIKFEIHCVIGYIFYLVTLFTEKINIYYFGDVGDIRHDHNHNSNAKSSVKENTLTEKKIEMNFKIEVKAPS